MQHLTGCTVRGTVVDLVPEVDVRVPRQPDHVPVPVYQVIEPTVPSKGSAAFIGQVHIASVSGIIVVVARAERVERHMLDHEDTALLARKTLQHPFGPVHLLLGKVVGQRCVRAVLEREEEVRVAEGIVKISVVGFALVADDRLIVEPCIGEKFLAAFVHGTAAVFRVAQLMVAHRFQYQPAVIGAVDDLAVPPPFLFRARGVGDLIARADDEAAVSFLDDLQRARKVLLRVDEVDVPAAVLEVDVDIGEQREAVMLFTCCHQRRLPLPSRYLIDIIAARYGFCKTV